MLINRKQGYKLVNHNVINIIQLEGEKKINNKYMIIMLLIIIIIIYNQIIIKKDVLFGCWLLPLCIYTIVVYWLSKCQMKLLCFLLS